MFKGKSRFYKEGYKDYGKGKHPHNNPYLRADWRHDEWFSGWADAQNDRLKKGK